jgi:four helix bundle protein
MTEITNSKPVYDLEERTFQFAKAVRLFVKTLPKTIANIANIEDGKQLVKASGSVGANYREANESLSKKDFVMRIKICRKEAKESAYWLRLIKETNSLTNADDAKKMIQEANELKKIFSSILEKSK